jgi:hypothetical protein
MSFSLAISLLSPILIAAATDCLKAVSVDTGDQLNIYLGLDIQPLVAI